MGVPILMKKRNCFNVPFLVIVGKHIGTGVLVALGLVHLLAPAMGALSGGPCLPAIFSDYAFAPVIAVYSILLMHLIETLVHGCVDRALKKASVFRPPDVKVQYHS